MRRPGEAHPRAPQPRGKHPHRHRRPETPVSRQPAAQRRRQLAQPRLRLLRDRIRPIRTRRARNPPRRIRITRTRTPITRARVPMEIRIRRVRPRNRARQIPAPRTQAPIPALRIPVPIRVRATPDRITQVLIILVRPTQLLRIRRQGIRLPAAAHRRIRAGKCLRSFPNRGPACGPAFLSIPYGVESDADGCCCVMQCIVPSPQTRSPEKIGTTSRVGNSLASVFSAPRSWGSLKTGTNTMPFAI